MIVVIDNYDSFTFNLVQLVESITGQVVTTFRNDQFEVADLMSSGPDAIVISPGPGTPDAAGRVLELIRANRQVPLLGVCLGHQALGQAHGARVIRGKEPVHGKVHAIEHDQRGLFRGAPQPMQAARYHSLILEEESLPSVFRVDARTADGTIMAISHIDLPLFGIQFHPESYGTVGGEVLMRNFFQEAHIDC